MDKADQDTLKRWLSYWKVTLADLELGRGVFTARQMQALQASVLSAERLADQRLHESGAWLEGGSEHQVLTLNTLRDWIGQDPSALVSDGEGRWLQGVVYPFVYILNRRHQRGQTRRQFAPQMVAPVSFTVRLYEDGRIYPEGRPGVPRELLDPSNGARPFVVGSVDDLDAFFDAHPFPEWEDPINSRWSLQEVIEYCQQMLETICGIDLTCPMGEDGPHYTSLEEPLIHKGRAGSGAIRPLLNTYDALMHKPDGIRVVQRLIQWKMSPRQVPGLEQSITTRTGSMEGVTLSWDQKAALASAMALPEGHVQAVNGPPGTGKTTVIKDIVASLICQAALNERPAPLIVIASNNNQAVTNVLDVFSRSDGLQKVERWIRDWHSFGAYAPAMSRTEQAAEEGYATIDQLRELERQHQPQHAERYFISKASEWAGKSFNDVEQAKTHLHRRVRQCASALRQVRELRRRFSRVDQVQRINAASVVVRRLRAATAGLAPQAFDQLRRWLKTARYHVEAIEKAQAHAQWIHAEHKRLRQKVPQRILDWLSGSRWVLEYVLPLMAPDVSQRAGTYWRDVVANHAGAKGVVEHRQALAKIAQSPDWEWVIPMLDQALDQTARVWLFEASIHYYEACWLQQMREVTTERQRSGRTHENVENALARRALLAPVLVGTFYTLPRHLSYWDAIAQKELPLTERADVVLVDEAGQASTEVAVPTLALTRKAVTIGDVAQLAPVRRITRPIDLANLMATGVAPKASNARELESHISDHVNFSKLSHQASLLDSVRPMSVYHQSEAGQHPHTGAHLVQHRRSIPSIIEFCNRLCYDGRLEPVRVSDDKPLEGVYWFHVPGIARRRRGSQVNDGEACTIAAWITEHASELHEQYPELAIGDIVGVVTPFHQQAQRIRQALDDAGLDPERKMTVGTIHSLQGAERPVVILSLTYSFPTNQPLFFDSEPQMLNVAVSRARDALVVAGDANVLAGGDRPAQMLLEHLRDQGDSQPLPQTDNAPWLCAPDDLEATLEGRDEHDRYLQQLLDAPQSWRRLWIASPVLGLLAAQTHGPKLVEAAAHHGNEVVIVISRQHSMIHGYDRALKELITNFERGRVSIRISEWFEGSWIRVDDDRVSISEGDWLSAMPEVRDWGLARREPRSLIVRGQSASSYGEAMTVPAQSQEPVMDDA